MRRHSFLTAAALFIAKQNVTHSQRGENPVPTKPAEQASASIQSCPDEAILSPTQTAGADNSRDVCQLRRDLNDLVDESNRTELAYSLYSRGIPLIKLILANKRSNQAKYVNEIAVIDLSELAGYLLQMVHYVLAPSEKRRLQLIVKNGGHYFYMDVEVTATETAKTLSIAVLDSVARNYDNIMTLLRNRLPISSSLGYRVFWLAENIQHDDETCYIFAIKLLSAAAKEINLHEHLAKSALAYGQIKWSHFPANFLKLCQSTLTFKSFMKEAFYREYAAANRPADLGALIRKFQDYGLAEHDVKSADSLSKKELEHYRQRPMFSLEKPVNKSGQSLFGYYAMYWNGKPFSDHSRNLAAKRKQDKYLAGIATLLEKITDEELDHLVNETLGTSLTK